MEILTLSEVANILHFSESHIRRLIKEDDFPHIQTKPGGRLLFKKKYIEAWLDRRSFPEPVSIKIKKIKLIGRR